MFEYGLLANVTSDLQDAMSAFLAAFAGYSGELLRFALDNPIAFVLSTSALVGLAFFARLR